MKSISARQRLRDQIDLPTPVGVWVIAAHAIAQFTPFLLIWVVYDNWEFVVANTYEPGLFYFAAAIMMATSAFEIAQNTFDNWYLEPGMGSTTDPALADFVFYLFSCSSFVILIAACMGNLLWLIGISVLLVGLFAFLYLTDRPPFSALGILGLVSTTTLFLSFGDPVVFMQIVTGQLTLYFFSLLLKTKSQSMHGLTAFTSCTGTWFLAWAISGSASGEPKSWTFVISLTIILSIAALFFKPRLEKLQATPRRSRYQS